MRISTPGGKKPDEVPILPRFVSDANVDLHDLNLDDYGKKDKRTTEQAWFCHVCKCEFKSVVNLRAHCKGSQHVRRALQNLDEKKEARIEATIIQVKDKLVSKSSLFPQPTKVVMKKKAKKTSACQAVCDFFGCMIVTVLLVLLGVSVARIYDLYTANSQIERHNNLVRYVDCLRKNQDVLYNGINDVITKVGNLTEKHNNTRDELSVVEYSIIDLTKELQTLKDSVKHIEEEMHHSDEEGDQVMESHGTPNPTTNRRADGQDLHDSDYPFSDSSMSYPESYH